MLTFLVVGKTYAQSSTTGINDFLKQVGGSMYPRISWYSGTQLDSLKSFSGDIMKTKTSEWSCLVATSPAKQEDALDLTVRFRLEKGEAVSVAFDFNDWNTVNYLMVPTAVYNGNRYRSIGNGYNPPYPKEMFYNPDLPLTISSNPKLSITDGQPSRIEIQTGYLATPAVCFYSPGLGKGLILLTNQGIRYGNSGIIIKENANRTKASIQISAPAVREQRAGFGDFFPSRDKAADWVEYCNGSTKSQMGNLRIQHGYQKPFKVKYWELDNEAYRRYEPEEYARLCVEYSKAMKAFEFAEKKICTFGIKRIIAIVGSMNLTYNMFRKLHPV